MSKNDSKFTYYGDIPGMSKFCARHQKRVLVCGSRDFNKGAYTEAQVFAKLDELKAGYLRNHYIVIVNGWGDGVDLAAAKWAESREIPFMNFPARWNLLGKMAGPYRNQLMLDIADPHIVVAFPGNKGTNDMKERAEQARIEIIEIEF